MNKKASFCSSFYTNYLAFFSCLRNSSTLRMNLYNGGPNNIPTKIITKSISFHPIAMTGSQASVLNKSASQPSRNLLFIDYFSIGILMP